MPKPLDFIWFPTKLEQGAEFEWNMTISHLLMKRSRSLSQHHCTENYLLFRCFFFCRSRRTRSLRPTSCKWKRRQSTSPQVNRSRRQETSLHSISVSEWHTFFLFLSSWVPITRSTYKYEMPHTACIKFQNILQQSLSQERSILGSTPL